MSKKNKGRKVPKGKLTLAVERMLELQAAHRVRASLVIRRRKQK